jgi:hypothetical protein
MSEKQEEQRSKITVDVNKLEKESLQYMKKLNEEI